MRRADDGIFPTPAPAERGEMKSIFVVSALPWFNFSQIRVGIIPLFKKN
jgi:hypothetical protein